MMNNEKEKYAIDASKLDEILPKYDPLKLNGVNLAQNYVSAFNTGMNIYQCVNQLQGYIEWVVKAVNDVVKSWDVQVGESIDQSKAIVRETTTEQFNTEWTNKQPELIEQVNTLTTNQFNNEKSIFNDELNALNARMDTFTSLSEGSTTGDAELQDIRIGANGATYSTAGGAVRGQYRQLNEDIINKYNQLDNKKVNLPTGNYSEFGEDGQLLRTHADGTTEWVSVGLPTDEQTSQSVRDWLNEHPEATTTVQDGSVGEEKLTPEFIKKLNKSKELRTIDDYRENNDIDDTMAFVRYFDDILKGHNYTLFINRNCTISSTIQLPINKYFTVTGIGEESTIFYDGIEKNVFYATKTQDGANQYLAGEFTNLYFINNKELDVTLFKEVGIYTSPFIVKSCRIRGFSSALDIEKSWNTIIQDCEIWNGRDGLILKWATASKVINTHIRFMTGTAIKLLKMGEETCVGTLIDKVMIEKVDVGIYIESLYTGHIVNSYFECNKDKPAIVADGIECVNIGNNLIRVDNKVIINNCRTVNVFGCCSIELPSETGTIKNLFLYGYDSDNYKISNLAQHRKNVLLVGLINDKNNFSPFYSQPPFTIQKDELIIEANGEVVLGYARSLYGFKLINYNGHGMWQASVLVYKDDVKVFESSPMDVAEYTILNPLYEKEIGDRTDCTYKITVKNIKDYQITIKGLALNYQSSMYIA